MVARRDLQADARRATARRLPGRDAGPARGRRLARVRGVRLGHRPADDPARRAVRRGHGPGVRRGRSRRGRRGDGRRGRPAAAPDGGPRRGHEQHRPQGRAHPAGRWRPAHLRRGPRGHVLAGPEAADRAVGLARRCRFARRRDRAASRRGSATRSRRARRDAGRAAVAGSRSAATVRRDRRAAGGRAGSRIRRPTGRRSPGRHSEPGTARAGRAGDRHRGPRSARYAAEVAMRRWNGWGDESVETHAPAARPRAARVARRARDAAASTRPSTRSPRPSRRRDSPPIAATRRSTLGRAIRHARGQSLPGLGRPADRAPGRGAGRGRPARRCRRRSGVSWTSAARTGTAAHPVRRRDERRRRRHGAPVRPAARDASTSAPRPGLHALDETSGLATFGAGTIGPAIEAALAPHGLTLGHYPQSFEASTVGGWVVTRSAGQQSRGFGRIEDLFAGGHLETPRGPLDLRPYPASAAGPDLREIVLGSEGRLGILTDVTVRASRPPEARAVQRLPRPATGTARCSWRGGSPSRACRCRWSASRRRSRPRRRSRSPATAGRPASSAATSACAGMGPERCLVIVGLTGQPGRRGRGREGRRRPRPGLAGHRAGRASGRPGGTAGSPRRTCATRCGTRATRSTRSRPRPTGRRCPGWPPRSGGRSGTGWRPRRARPRVQPPVARLSERARACTSTYVFRLAADPDETLERWRTLKTRRQPSRSSSTGRRSATSTASAPTTRRISRPRRARSGWTPSRRSSGRSTRTA